MDQKEIDELLKKGSLDDFSEKQQEIFQQIGHPQPSQPSPPPQAAAPEGDAAGRRKEGRVIGQLSKVSEEAEAGTNMVMNYLENVITIISKLKNYQKNVEAKFQADPAAVHLPDVFQFINDTTFLIEDLIFNAMDAFQFQDINRQKLMKVMYTLARLNEYLNELLGVDEQKEKTFGHQIEQTGLQKDAQKDDVDMLIEEFQKKNL